MRIINSLNRPKSILCVVKGGQSHIKGPLKVSTIWKYQQSHFNVVFLPKIEFSTSLVHLKYLKRRPSKSWIFVQKQGVCIKGIWRILDLKMSHLLPEFMSIESIQSVIYYRCLILEEFYWRRLWGIECQCVLTMISQTFYYDW